MINKSFQNTKSAIKNNVAASLKNWMQHTHWQTTLLLPLPSNFAWPSSWGWSFSSPISNKYKIPDNPQHITWYSFQKVEVCKGKHPPRTSPLLEPVGHAFIMANNSGWNKNSAYFNSKLPSSHTSPKIVYNRLGSPFCEASPRIFHQSNLWNWRNMDRLWFEGIDAPKVFLVPSLRDVVIRNQCPIQQINSPQSSALSLFLIVDLEEVSMQ